jgi:hypothetical protein
VQSQNLPGRNEENRGLGGVLMTLSAVKQMDERRIAKNSRKK